MGSCCKLRETAAREELPEASLGLQCSWVLTAANFACSCLDRWLITLPGLGQDRLHLLYTAIWCDWPRAFVGTLLSKLSPQAAFQPHIWQLLICVCVMIKAVWPSYSRAGLAVSWGQGTEGIGRKESRNEVSSRKRAITFCLWSLNACSLPFK